MELVMVVVLPATARIIQRSGAVWLARAREPTRQLHIQQRHQLHLQLCIQQRHRHPAPRLHALPELSEMMERLCAAPVRPVGTPKHTTPLPVTPARAAPTRRRRPQWCARTVRWAATIRLAAALAIRVRKGSIRLGLAA